MLVWRRGRCRESSRGANGVTVFGAGFGYGAGAYVAISPRGDDRLSRRRAHRLADRPLGEDAQLVERHGRWFHVSPDRLDRAESWFERWGGPASSSARLTPVVRSFVAIAAGLFEMPLLPFTLLSLARLGRVVVRLRRGSAMGSARAKRSFDHNFRYVEYAIAVGILAALAYLVYRWMAQAKVAPRADDSSR